jgi:UDPglucose--hexose-1-phosphate uridylyltransferase
MDSRFLSRQAAFGKQESKKSKAGELSNFQPAPIRENGGMSEIRENLLTGEWVIIAPERARRGGNLVAAPPVSEVPSYLATCPFCAGNEGATEQENYRVCGADGQWIIRSVVNKFSVLSPTGEVSPHSARPGIMSVNGVGLHEVLIESPRHDEVLALAPASHVRLVLEAYRHRFTAFYDDPRVRHVVVFKNHGADAGASQQHPHSQIVGMPIVPGQVEDRLHRARKFHANHGHCLACAIIEHELAHGTRIVAENAAFVAFIPHAALSPYHLWIFPKAHSGCFSEGTDFDSLAEIVHTILVRVYGVLGNPAYNLIVRSLGPSEADSPHFHWYVSVVPRVNKSAGFELGTGMYVNPSSPDECATALREFELR